MTKRRRLNVGLGLKRTSVPQFPSEAGYVAAMNAQVRELTDTLIDVFDQFEDASIDIMLEALEPTGEKSKYYCPKDTHALVESYYLQEASFRGKPRVEMGYAKGGLPRYAVFVHEIPMYHADPTRYKFLEQALKEDIDDIFTRVATGYQEFMNGATRG